MFRKHSELNMQYSIHEFWHCFSELTPCKNPPTLVTVAMSDKPCRSHITHHVLTQKKKTDNIPNNKTEQVTSGMKQGLRILSVQIFYLFLRNSNNKYCFVSL